MDVTNLEVGHGKKEEVSDLNYHLLQVFAGKAFVS